MRTCKWGLIHSHRNLETAMILSGGEWREGYGSRQWSTECQEEMSCQGQAWKKPVWVLFSKRGQSERLWLQCAVPGEGKAGEMVNRWVSFREIWQAGLELTQKTD